MAARLRHSVTAEGRLGRSGFDGGSCREAILKPVLLRAVQGGCRSQQGCGENGTVVPTRIVPEEGSSSHQLLFSSVSLLAGPDCGFSYRS